MPLNHDRGKEKNTETLNEIARILRSKQIDQDDAEKISQLIVNSAIKINSPELEEFVVTMVTTNPSGRGGGKSVKAGNISLNMKHLIEAIANGAFAVVGSYQVPWLAPMAFIVLWSSLQRTVEIELSENDAAIIWGMWVYRDKESNEVSEKDLLVTINKHLQKYERLSISQKDLNHSLDNLTKVGCIKRSSKNIGNWSLCERVRSSYR